MTAVPATVPAAAPPGRSGRSRWWLLADLLVVVLLVGVALALRWPALAPSSLWLDDAWVALVHRTEGWQELRFVGFAAPGFAALLRGWLALAGFSELQAQVPALVAGVLLGPAVYLLTRWRGWHPVAGVLGGVTLVVSPIAITYATRVKQYTTEGLLTVAVLALALWVVDRPGDDRRWAALIGVGLVGTVVSAFLAPSVGAAVLAGLVAALRRGDRRGSLRAVAWGTGYGAVALMWYALVLAPAVTTSISGFWSEEFLVLDAGVGALLDSAVTAAGGVLSGWLPVRAAIGGGLLLLAMSALVLAARDHRADPVVEDEVVLLVLFLGAGALGSALAALQLAPLGGGRTDLYLYPSLSLLLVVGADAAVRSLRGRSRWASAVWLGLLVLLSAGLLRAAEPVGPYPAWDVRPLAAEVEVRAQDDDALLIYPATMWAYALYTDGEVELVPDEGSAWGFAPRFADPRVHVLPRGRDDPGAYLPTVSMFAAGDTGVVWLLASHWREDIEELRAQLERAGFDGEQVDRRPGAVLERFERR